jgi:hypothetical protein
MQPRDEEVSDEEKQEKLDQDYQPPFSPAEDIKGGRRLSKQDPHLDENADSDEWYQEGAAAAGGLPDDQADEGEDEDGHGERIA